MKNGKNHTTCQRRYNTGVWTGGWCKGVRGLSQIYGRAKRVVESGLSPPNRDCPRHIGRISVMSPENFIAPYKKGDFIGQDYEVYDVLGMGGFGIVYLVYFREAESVFALKTFREEYLWDREAQERFKKEAKIWIDLERHPYPRRGGGGGGEKGGGGGWVGG